MPITGLLTGCGILGDDFTEVEILNFSKFSEINLYNGNRTEGSPIQSVIIQVINKIG